MSTPTERPPEDNRTPQAIARAIAQLATAPVRDFVDCISDEDNTRDHLYQRLVARLTADEPRAWSKAREDDVEERLRESLATEENMELFHQYMDHSGTKLAIGESAAFLLGVEVGRQVSPALPDDGLTAANETEDPAPAVDEVMSSVISTLRLAEAITDVLARGETDVDATAFWSLSDLLEDSAVDLEKARDRYCAESNALVAVAESGGAA